MSQEETCTFPFNDICSPRYGKPIRGSEFRQVPKPYLFVIHSIDSSVEDYLTMVQSSIPLSVRYYGTPRSVHFYIPNENIPYALVSPDNTAWGFNEPYDQDGITQYITQMPLNPDASVIHIAFEKCDISNSAVDWGARVICCLGKIYDIPVDETTVIDAVEISPDLDGLQRNPDLIARLLSNKGICDTPLNPPISIVDPNLLQCCIDNSAAIRSINEELTRLRAEIALLKAEDIRLATLVSNVEACCAQNEAIANQINELTQLVLQMKECTDCVCPNVVPKESIHYSCSEIQTVTSNTYRAVNFCNKIADSTPPSVLTGPMWTDCIKTVGRHTIKAIVRLRSRRWCAGKKIRMEAIVCGNRYLLQEITTTNGTYPVTLDNSASPLLMNISSQCCVSIEVFTNDMTDVLSFIEYADYERTEI